MPTSDLFTYLEKIKYLYLNKYPRLSNCISPGLSDSQIDEITKELPFNLPGELRELYKWSNGFVDGDIDEYLSPRNYNTGESDVNIYCFDGHIILPLEIAVQEYLYRVKNSQIEIKGYFDPTDLLLYFDRPEDFIYNTEPLDAFGSNCFQIFMGYIGREMEGFAIINGVIEGYKVANDFQQNCHIILTCKRDEVRRRYKSLLAMMQALAL